MQSALHQQPGGSLPQAEVSALDFVLQPVSYSTAEVARGAQFEVVLPVSGANSGDVIVWKFETEEHDVAFEVRFTTVGGGGATVAPWSTASSSPRSGTRTPRSSPSPGAS
jgi:hypothetical protein